MRVSRHRREGVILLALPPRDLLRQGLPGEWSRDVLCAGVAEVRSPFPAVSDLPPPFASCQTNHWRTAHKAVCCKPLGGGGAQFQPLLRVVTAADRDCWQSLCDSAVLVGRAGKYSEARSSMERVVAEVEGVAGKEEKELVGR